MEEEKREIDFHLQEGSSISGTVRDMKTNEPIEMVNIELVESTNQIIKAAYSGSQDLYPNSSPLNIANDSISTENDLKNHGKYIIEAIPSGIYLLRFGYYSKLE